jgi:DNA-directed RNA polymerase
MDLFKEQSEIEARMSDRGIERYKRLSAEARADGEATRSKAVQTVLDSAVESVSKAIVAFTDKAKKGGGGRRHTAIKHLAGIDPSEAAFVTLRILLDGIAKDVPVTPLATSIGRTLELEARMNHLESTQSAYVRKVMSDLEGRTDHTRHRRAVLSKVLREKGDKWEAWGERDNLHTGLKLMELVVEATGLFIIRTDRIGKKTVTVLAVTDRFQAWLHSLDTRFALMTPEYLPCVIPPKDWTGFLDGGYHTDALAYPPSFVKTSCRRHKDALKRADLSKVQAAVNAIQQTPWAVNLRVLEVARTLIEEGRPMAGLPDMENLPLPTQPGDIDTNEVALKDWKREAARTYDSNRRLTGRRVGVLKSLQIAMEFADYDAIYFPYQLDFRGRVYPIPQGLNPQGNDLAKGLLHFAEGEALDTTAAIHWFKVHGANCFGVDKVSFDDRMKWVDDNAEHIIRSAEDPLNYQWWVDADSPFCFLAWAFEFNDWLTSGADSGAFKSHIAVAMDGSCNGLQHYSAMLRDPRGGGATNLLPSDKPQDIYGEVAKVVMRKLAMMVTEGRRPGADEEARASADMAERWGRYGVDRKITKRPVMVLPYGGTQRSCFDYVYDAVKERGGYPFNDEDLHKASVFLGGVVWASIGEVVVAARLAMGWLKAAAGVASKAGLPLHWKTPSGFPVIQAYPQMTSHRVECYLFGSRMQPRLDVADDDKLDARRQMNGIAPNFVHSLDAAALIDTVNRARAAGVTKFAMIHDSYGTTAAQSALLATNLREAFVGMYEGPDVMGGFLNDAVPETLRGSAPSAPFVGGLDLKQVLKSDYFFA